nr:EOG090X08PA [Eulimnadia texana]
MWILRSSSQRHNWLLLTTLLCLLLAWFANAGIHSQDIEDNEFAEFEDFEVEEPAQPIQEQESPPAEETVEEPAEKFEPDEDEATVETEENEFEAVDEDEFEGYNGQAKSQQGDKSSEGPKLTFAKLPAHLRSNWESYYMELLILSGLFVYFLNFFMGRSKNQKIAEIWYDTFKSLLEENFALVGDDGKIENSNPGLMKESENVHLLWCSGRSGCEGMLVELRLKKRQDLISVLSGFFRPQQDKVVVKIFMNEDEMDTYVMCLGQKKSATKLVKELADLSVFSPEKKSVEKFGLPSNFVLLNEIGEAASSLLDTRVCSTVNKFPELFDSIHISDQYSGPKLPEDTAPSKMPDVEKVLIFTFNLTTGGGKSLQDAVEAQRSAMQLVFYMVERVKRFRLSKEGKVKAEKNRQKVEEAFLKSTHMARAEAAAARREERRRQEKEKILQDDDPEKQRKWEEKEAKRMAKKKTPKMKAIRV